MHLVSVFVLFFVTDGSQGTLAILKELTFQKIEYLQGFIHENQTLTKLVATVEDCALTCAEIENCLSFTFLLTECHMYNVYFFILLSSKYANGAHTYTRKRDSTVRECSNGFLLAPHGEFCYKIMKGNGKTWFDAATECQQMESSLFILDSNSKVAAYNEIVTKYSIWKCWTGGYDVNGQNKDWIWLNGKPIMQHLWRDLEPNNANEKCVEAISYDVLLNDQNCSVARPFICEQSFQK